MEYFQDKKLLFQIMESDVGDDLAHSHDSEVDSGDVNAAGEPSHGIPAGVLGGPLGVQSSSVQNLEITQPLAAKLNKLTCDNDEPKPGPSNSAADFDLEVFFFTSLFHKS